MKHDRLWHWVYTTRKVDDYVVVYWFTDADYEEAVATYREALTDPDMTAVKMQSDHADWHYQHPERFHGIPAGPDCEHCMRDLQYARTWEYPDEK